MWYKVVAEKWRFELRVEQTASEQTVDTADRERREQFVTQHLTPAAGIPVLSRAHEIHLSSCCLQIYQLLLESLCLCLLLLLQLLRLLLLQRGLLFLLLPDLICHLFLHVCQELRAHPGRICSRVPVQPHSGDRSYDTADTTILRIHRRRYTLHAAQAVIRHKQQTQPV